MARGARPDPNPTLSLLTRLLALTSTRHTLNHITLILHPYPPRPACSQRPKTAHARASSPTRSPEQYAGSVDGLREQVHVELRPHLPHVVGMPSS